MPRSTQSLRPCSNGSSMPSPIERPPASEQPRLAASIAPGPPPVITAKPASASAAPSSRPISYSAMVAGVRAEPNTVTARGSSASMPKPSTNSAWIRSTRHGSVCTQSLGPRESSSRWSVVVSSWLYSPRSTTGPRCFSSGPPARRSPSRCCGPTRRGPRRSTSWRQPNEAPSPGPVPSEVAPQDVRATGDGGLGDVLLAGVREVRVAGPVVDRRDAERGEPGHVGPAVLGPRLARR